MNRMEGIPTRSREPDSRSPGLPQRLIERVRRLKLAHWIWIGAVAAVTLLLVFLAWPRPMTVEAASVDRGLVTRDVIDEARTRILDVFTISAPVGGELQRIELDPGDAVAAGQAVAVILPTDPALLDARTAAEAGAAGTPAPAAP